MEGTANPKNENGLPGGSKIASDRSNKEASSWTILYQVVCARK